MHKPPGPTSFSLVQAAHQAAQSLPSNQRPRICHGGTLDPFAQGLLLILVEPATRLFDHLHAIPKTYIATIRWGIETDNGDPLGAVTSTGNASHLHPQMLDEALTGFSGWHDQIPHATSAKRIDGERAYVKAHRGEAVNMPASQVYLHEARWLSHDLPHSSVLHLTVRGGYYVRALARDLGRSLQCGAHVSKLHRQSIGPWQDPGAGSFVAVTGSQIMPWAQSRTLSDNDIGLLRTEKVIPVGTLRPPDWRLPVGFPDPAAPVRGFHRGQFCFLLKHTTDQLTIVSPLPGGL